MSLLSLLVLVALWLGGAGRVAAQSPVTFEVTAEPDIVTVGDRIRVTATLTLPADAQADLKSLESQFGDLELLVVGLPQDTTLPDGRRQVQQTYEVAAFRTGTTQLPALNLAVRLSDGSDVTATSQPLPINVESVIPPDENPTDVRDLKPQISFPPVNGISWRSVALAVAAVALALAAALLLLRRLRRPQPVPEPTPVPAPSPEAIARAELDRIAASLPACSPNPMPSTSPSTSPPPPAANKTWRWPTRSSRRESRRWRSWCRRRHREHGEERAEDNRQPRDAARRDAERLFTGRARRQLPLSSRPGRPEP